MLDNTRPPVVSRSSAVRERGGGRKKLKILHHSKSVGTLRFEVQLQVQFEIRAKIEYRGSEWRDRRKDEVACQPNVAQCSRVKRNLWTTTLSYLGALHNDVIPTKGSNANHTYRTTTRCKD
jgi:hypothetical protein